MTTTMNGGTVLRNGVVIMDVTFHHPGVYRTEKGAKMQTEANQRWLSVSKRIFDSDKFRAALRVQDAVFYQLRDWSVPCGLAGYYAIPVNMLPKVYDYMDAKDEELKEAVEAFITEYADVRQRAKEQLKDLFDERQYPTEGYIRRGFWVERRLVELGVPEPAKVGEAFAAAEREKAAAYWNEAAKTVTYALREAFGELVGHLAERLEPNADGTKKRLHESAVTNLTNWIDLFAQRNVLDDQALAGLVNKARDLINGKDVEALRDDNALRGKLAADMRAVKAVVDELVTDAPARRIRFDD